MLHTESRENVDEEYDRMSNKLGGRTMKTKVYHGTIETVKTLFVHLDEKPRFWPGLFM